MAITIHISEHKSQGSLRPSQINNSVRVFVDNDYSYGYFYPELELFNSLTPEQQKYYLESDSVKLQVPASLAQKIIDEGTSILKYRPVVTDPT